MKFLDKHEPNAKPDPALAKVIKKMARDGEIACAVAFAIAEETNTTPSIVGRAVDLCGLHLVKCRLGLFGYKPNKKIVKPASIVAPDLEQEIFQISA